MAEAALMSSLRLDDKDSAKDQLPANLSELGFTMRVFSLCMRSLYGVGDVGNATEQERQFQALRDDVRMDANVYVHAILPITEETVRQVEKLFKKYSVLKFDQWKKILSRILGEVRNIKALVSQVKEWHENILPQLKKCQDRAFKMVAKLELDTKSKKEEAKQSRENADSYDKWAFALLFVPVVNVIATPILSGISKRYAVEASGANEQANVIERVRDVVKGPLVESVNRLILGIDNINGFLSKMENDLKSHIENVEVSKEDQDVEELLEVHFETHKANAEDIKEACGRFMVTIPGVRTDLKALPTDAATENYVQEWIEKEKKNIESRQGGYTRMLLAIYDSLPSRRPTAEKKELQPFGV